MANSRPPNLAGGGVYAWRLPVNVSCSSVARTLVEITMITLGMERTVIGDGKIAVTEAATNALRHGGLGIAPATIVPPELWIWARTAPAPQLVISIFEAAAADPRRGCDGSASFGRHASTPRLLGAFAAQCGGRFSRSRLARPRVSGHAVWFTLPLPSSWPGPMPAVPPARAAHALMTGLSDRGIAVQPHSDDKGVSMLELPGVNVWVDHTGYSWQSCSGTRVHLPLLDLQEATEHLMHRVEQTQARTGASPGAKAVASPGTGVEVPGPRPDPQVISSSFSRTA